MSSEQKDSAEQPNEAFVDQAIKDADVIPPPDDVGAVDETAQLRVDLAAAKDQALRAHAELDNFRKRVYRQMEDERKYSCVPVLCDLLPVVDNLQRAIDAAGNSESGEGLLEGVKLVAQQLNSVLQQHHCTPMEVAGKLFDPHLHEAIGKFPNDQYDEGTIAEVTQVGYQLHDRVVRPAQVLVSAGPPAEPSGDVGQQPAPVTS